MENKMMIKMNPKSKYLIIRKIEHKKFTFGQTVIIEHSP
jgi:hypothetical protein